MVVRDCLSMIHYKMKLRQGYFGGHNHMKNLPLRSLSIRNT
jgi:hypothetical protein